MGKARLEAFSDGVLAIVITIMVLELKVPHGEDLAALCRSCPVFFSYVLSFIYVGIYWNNHHHMLHTVQTVSGGVLWSESASLFWLSLFPFATGFMGENHFAADAVGAVRRRAARCGRSHTRSCSMAIIRAQGKDSLLQTAVGRRLEGQSVAGRLSWPASLRRSSCRGSQRRYT